MNRYVQPGTGCPDCNASMPDGACLDHLLSKWSTAAADELRMARQHDRMERTLRQIAAEGAAHAGRWSQQRAREMLHTITEESNDGTKSI